MVYFFGCKVCGFASASQQKNGNKQKERNCGFHNHRFLIGEAKKHDIKVLFVSNQFSQTSAKTISKNLNANVVTLDPLSQDFTNEILKTANEIARSYQ
jgi:ABC-type Zn2+ transport system substrate-binding protein/surface adhesin